MIETRTRPQHQESRHETLPARRVWWVGILLASLVAAAWFLMPTLRAEVGDLVEMIAAGRVDALGDRLGSYGLWGPIISLGIMVLQGILAPLPAFVVSFANGLAFGPFAGWLISLAGHVLASSVCFAIRGAWEGDASNRSSAQGHSVRRTVGSNAGGPTRSSSRGLFLGSASTESPMQLDSRRSASGVSSWQRPWVSFRRRSSSPISATRRTSMPHW